MGGQQKNKIIEYVIFPLNMIQGLLNADIAEIKFMINKILGYGLVNVALNYFSYEEYSLARQALYLYYNKKLPKEFLTRAQKAVGNGDLLVSLETRGFSHYDEGFNPDPEEVKSMYSFIQKHSNTEVIDWCKISFHVPHKLIKDIYEIYTNELINQEYFLANYGNDSSVSIKQLMLRDFYNDPPKPDLLSCYVALRSIQGRKRKYMKTYKKTILLRMSGCKSYDVYNENVSFQVKEKLDQISKKRTFNKLLESLEDRGLITGRLVLPKTNCFILSTSENYLELANLYATATEEPNKKIAQKRKEALELFNQLISKK